MSGASLLRSAIVIAFAAAMACASVAAVAAGDGPVVQVSRVGGYAENPVLGVDDRGDRTVAWTDYASRGTTPLFSVLTASRLAGSGSWSTATAVSGVSEGPDAPALAVASSGAAVIAWSETVPDSQKGYVIVLRAATRASASADWTTPVTISAAGAESSRVSVGIDRAGEATVAWNQNFSAHPPIEAATGSATTGQWRASQQLAAAGHGGTDPQLTVNDRGDVVVAWPRQVGRTNHRHAQPTIHYAEMAAYRPAGQAWHAPVAIGGLSEIEPGLGANVWAPSTPTIALDASGDATVMWQSMNGNGQVLEIARRSRTETRWHAAQQLTLNPTAPVIGTDARGRLTVVWTDRQGRILDATSDTGAHWTHPATIAGATGAFLTWLSVGADGNAILTWLGPHSQIRLSTRKRSGSDWTRPVAVGRGGLPQAALDQTGTATLAWPRLLPAPTYGADIDTTTYP